MNNSAQISNVFKAFSDLFSFPEKKRLPGDLFSQENIDAFGIEELALADEFKALETEISKYSEQDLMVEYAKLFVGPYSLLAPPYGSYYLDGGTVMGETTVAVKQLYELAGITISDNFKDLPDHVIAELEFLYVIYHNLDKFSESDDKDTVKKIEQINSIFYNDYFITWIPQFCEKIEEKSENSFYQKSASLLKKVVDKIKVKKSSISN